jgi:hypothetical protein
MDRFKNSICHFIQVLILLLLVAVVCGLPAPQNFDGPRDRFRGDGRPEWRWSNDNDRPVWPDQFNNRPDWPHRHHHRPNWDRRPDFNPQPLQPGFFLGNVIGGRKWWSFRSFLGKFLPNVLIFSSHWSFWRWNA